MSIHRMSTPVNESFTEWVLTKPYAVGSEKHHYISRGARILWSFFLHLLHTLLVLFALSSTYMGIKHRYNFIYPNEAPALAKIQHFTCSHNLQGKYPEIDDSLKLQLTFLSVYKYNPLGQKTSQGMPSFTRYFVLLVFSVNQRSIYAQSWLQGG